ncbi:proteasomal ubiquitin receptor ADRM1 isoform X1 [Lethenteron reissneri]|uniref:proteasomal ubiquitin receptor ADRM1 isoform X1 n=1 Tax=Lethenteron reissneri TaxID=7753 RepID=UPI002AB65C59|nr:proteasomal ubiquitin receptor ADRM1 isoform X1 [Lethenteron reissneri]
MSSSSGALFPSAVASSRGAASKYLVEFRAGKMSLRGGTVTPDSRKGLVFVHQSEDALLHLCWRDRTTGQLEEDLIIFPDDCEFKRVPQCTTGRVFVLKFKAGSRRLFFWMQEPKTDKDDELCKKVNDLLNNPPVPGSVGSGSSSHGLSSDLAALGGEGGLQSLLGNMDQQQLMQLMGASGLGGLGGLGALAGLLGSGHSSGSRGQVGSLARSVSSARAAATSASSASASSSSSTATTTTTTTTAVPTAETPPSVTPVPPVTTVPAAATATPVPATAPTMLPAVPTAVPTQPIQLSDLQSILTSMNVPTSPGATATQPALDLAAVLTPDIMAPILANPEVQQRLLPFLPAGEALPLSPNEIQSTMSSPQFQQQAMSMFSAALGSGQLGPLMSQFGLPDEAVQAAGHGDVEGFARAMQGRPGGAGTTEGAPSGDVEPSGDKKDEEEDMSLD